MTETQNVVWTKQAYRAYDWDKKDGSAFTVHDYWLRAANVLIQVTQTPKKENVRVCVFEYTEEEYSRTIKQTKLIEEWVPTLEKAQKRGVEVAAGYLEQAASRLRAAPFNKEHGNRNG